MRKIRILPALIILAVFLAACAPTGQSTATNPPVAAASEAPPAAPATATTAPALEEPIEAVVITEAAALPVATSRGPDLHATDPTTVSLASGGLQFVEFFRFT